MKKSKDLSIFFSVLVIGLLLTSIVPFALAEGGGGGGGGGGSSGGSSSSSSSSSDDSSSSSSSNGADDSSSSSSGADDSGRDSSSDLSDDSSGVRREDRRNDRNSEAGDDRLTGIDGNRGLDDGVQLNLNDPLNAELANKALSMEPGVVRKVGREIEDGKEAVKVSITREDNSRVDVVVDKQTKEVIRIKFDDGRDIRMRNEIQIQDGLDQSSVKVQKQQAIGNALKLFSGSLDRIELEKEDDSRIVWNVRLASKDGIKADIRLDANTGDLVRTRVEGNNQDRDKDGINDLFDSDTTKNTDKDHDGIDNVFDKKDDRFFLLRFFSWMGFIN